MRRTTRRRTRRRRTVAVDLGLRRLKGWGTVRLGSTSVGRHGRAVGVEALFRRPDTRARGCESSRLMRLHRRSRLRAPASRVRSLRGTRARALVRRPVSTRRATRRWSCGWRRVLSPSGLGRCRSRISGRRTVAWWRTMTRRRTVAWWRTMARRRTMTWRRTMTLRWAMRTPAWRRTVRASTRRGRRIGRHRRSARQAKLVGGLILSAAPRADDHWSHLRQGASRTRLPGKLAGA